METIARYLISIKHAKIKNVEVAHVREDTQEYVKFHQDTADIKLSVKAIKAGPSRLYFLLLFCIGLSY